LYIYKTRADYRELTGTGVVAERFNETVISHNDSSWAVNVCSVKKLLTGDLV
jgi:hypothetical protein